jgi:hypothetical protein
MIPEVWLHPRRPTARLNPIHLTIWSVGLIPTYGMYGKFSSGYEPNSVKYLG